MAGEKVHGAAHSILALDGQIAGSLSSVSVQGNVLTFEPGGQFPGLKRVSGQGNVLSFEFGSGMSSAFFKWIDAFMKRSAKPRQIVLYFTDSGYEVQSARVYDNAKITELVFPKLDAASKDPVRMALTLTASKLSDRSPSGKLKLPAASGKLLCSNFKIEINSMPTERVLRINRFTVSGSRNSNLIIGVPIIDMEPFQQWFDNVVVSGSRSDRRKTGALEYLTQNLKDVGFTLSYGELRIVRFSLGSSKSKDRIASFEVEMTVSRASFDAPNALMSWPQGI